MATKANSACADANVRGYVSQNVYNGVRIKTGGDAAAQLDRAKRALRRAEEDCAAQMPELKFG
jgi:hypothetical protein